MNTKFHMKQFEKNKEMEATDKSELLERMRGMSGKNKEEENGQEVEQEDKEKNEQGKDEKLHTKIKTLEEDVQKYKKLFKDEKKDKEKAERDKEALRKEVKESSKGVSEKAYQKVEDELAKKKKEGYEQSRKMEEERKKWEAKEKDLESEKERLEDVEKTLQKELDYYRQNYPAMVQRKKSVEGRLKKLKKERLDVNKERQEKNEVKREFHRKNKTIHDLREELKETKKDVDQRVQEKVDHVLANGVAKNFVGFELEELVEAVRVKAMREWEKGEQEQKRVRKLFKEMTAGWMNEVKHKKVFREEDKGYLVKDEERAVWLLKKPNGESLEVYRSKVPLYQGHWVSGTLVHGRGFYVKKKVNVQNVGNWEEKVEQLQEEDEVEEVAPEKSFKDELNRMRAEEEAERKTVDKKEKTKEKKVVEKHPVGLSLLVVSDAPDHHKRQFLEALGHEVEWMNGYEENLHLIQKRIASSKFDVVLLVTDRVPHNVTDKNNEWEDDERILWVQHSQYREWEPEIKKFIDEHVLEVG